MNTQNTPVHICLWHREFWLMAFASLLLTMSVYVMLPVMPEWLMQTENFTAAEAGACMGVFALGLYTFGVLCSWLVQHYRRNMVCMWAMVAMLADFALLQYIDSLQAEFVDFWLIMLHRFSLGSAFGLAQMVLSSTLIIDTCESFQRTEANHSASWFSRFALSLGPLAGVVGSAYGDFHTVVWCAMGCAFTALLLVNAVDFPFRTPEEGVHVASLDRFFLPHGFVLFGNLLLFSVVSGMVLSLPHDALFYIWLMGGFMLALLAQHFVYRDAELKSEVVSGQILMVCALLVLLAYPSSPVAPVLMGLAIGLVASRFLLFFIKLSRHCQRGTSQSTFFLGWETGLALGLGVGYAFFFEQRSALINTTLVITTVDLLVYHLYTHSWFVRNKNR